MIIKSLTRTSAGSGGARGLMNYMFQQKKMLNQLAYQTRGDQLSQLSVTHLLKGEGVQDWVREFEETQAGRKQHRRGGVIMYHDIISFARKDTDMLDHSKLKDIARKYIQLRSPTGQAVATFHFDARHVHIHVALAGAKYLSGEANRVSKQSFHETKMSMEAYQRKQYPELMNSLVEHGRASREKSEQEFQKEKRSDSPSKRSMVKERIGQLFEQAASTEELYQLLEQANMPHYTRGDKAYGVTADGRNYRFSTLGFTETLKSLEQQDFLLTEFEQLRSMDSSRSSRLERLDRLDNELRNTQEVPIENHENTPFRPMDDFEYDRE